MMILGASAAARPSRTSPAAPHDCLQSRGCHTTPRSSGPAANDNVRVLSHGKHPRGNASARRGGRPVRINQSWNYSRERRGLSRDHEDGVAATWHRVDAVAATTSLRSPRTLTETNSKNSPKSKDAFWAPAPLSSMDRSSDLMASWRTSYSVTRPRPNPS